MYINRFQFWLQFLCTNASRFLWCFDVTIRLFSKDNTLLFQRWHSRDNLLWNSFYDIEEHFSLSYWTLQRCFRIRHAILTTGSNFYQLFCDIFAYSKKNSELKISVNTLILCSRDFPTGYSVNTDNHVHLDL